MKVFIIKIVSVNLKNGEATLFYTGKDGYLWRASEYPTGWKKKYYAEYYINHILRETDEKIISDCIGLSDNKRLSHYEIIEREDN